MSEQLERRIPLLLDYTGPGIYGARWDSEGRGWITKLLPVDAEEWQLDMLPQPYWKSEHITPLLEVQDRYLFDTVDRIVVERF